MHSSFGFAQGVLRMFTIMGWLMIVAAMVPIVLTWAKSDAAVLSKAFVLLIYGVVMTFVSEAATAQLIMAENTAMLVADMHSLMEKIGSQLMVSMEGLRDFHEQKGRAKERRWPIWLSSSQRSEVLIGKAVVVLMVSIVNFDVTDFRPISDVRCL